jgi:pimeloyl-ACP methyl ester carboxylesterase
MVISLLGLPTMARPDDPPADSSEIKPFEIHVDQAILDDLRGRLDRARIPDEVANEDWAYGVNREWLVDFVETWKTSYDWRAEERRLNAFPQFKTEIDGLDVHFIHQRSKHENALPLVIIHGWPGSFVEFCKIIDPLVNPEAHGGTADEAFHVVVPSLPGFGFSDKPREPGWSVQRMSDVVAQLMARLGYAKYGAQGGDWGAGVARWLGNYDAEHCVGLHINFVTAGQPQGDDSFAGVPEAEKARWQKRRDELASHGAYAAIQGSRPQTIGTALNDSPVGLAAWIVDKFWAWSDHGGNLDNSFTKEELITNVMIYWVTETPASAARIYFERQGYNGGRKSGRAPVGCAIFPKEISVPPRKWAELQYNIIHWTEMPRGGHFAAMEQPDLLVKDVRAFFRGLR